MTRRYEADTTGLVPAIVLPCGLKSVWHNQF